MSENEACGDIIEEHGIKIYVRDNSDKPTKTKLFYNSQMAINREFVLCSLVAFAKDRSYTACLDAFGASGLNGMLWKKNLEEKIDVLVADIEAEAIDQIHKNITDNGFRLKKPACLTVGQPGREAQSFIAKIPRAENKNPSESTEVRKFEIEVEHCDANVVLHKRAFDFIFLDPFGSPVQYLDASFRNTRDGGLVYITATDLATLYSNCPQVAERFYNVHIIDTDYIKEFAVRMVLAAAARSAARCKKGISVLFSLVEKNCVATCVQIKRGPEFADECVRNLKKVIHCRICEERAFCPYSNIPICNPIDLLLCDCDKSSPGINAVELGPVWSGEIFFTPFILDMIAAAESLKLSDHCQSLLKLMLDESDCPVSGVDQNSRSHKEAVNGRSDTRCPVFYYNLSKRKLKELVKLDKMVEETRKAEYRCSRTHFNNRSLRTNATSSQLVAIAERCLQEKD